MAVVPASDKPNAFGFHYVLIPCEPADPMQELFFPKQVTLEKDTFQEMMRGYFGQRGNVDRTRLLEGLKAHAKAEQVDQLAQNKKMLDVMATTATTEIFSVTVPIPANGNFAVSMYCDDKGVAKDLGVNDRATGLSIACGYDTQQFRGDIFISRIFDDQEAWERRDFILADMSSDAKWVQASREMRAKHPKGGADMQRLKDSLNLGGNGRGVQTIGMDDQKPQKEADMPSGETDTYKWKQTADDVEVTFPLVEGAKKGDVKVTIGREKLIVLVKGTSLVDCKLANFVDADDSTWILVDGNLQVTLAKKAGEQWAELVKAE